MAWRIVRQPNGLLARFSDVVDDFTHMNLTVEEALRVCGGTEEAKKKVLNGLSDLKQDGTPGNGSFRWKDCLNTIKLMNGKRAAKAALSENRMEMTMKGCP